MEAHEWDRLIEILHKMPDDEVITAGKLFKLLTTAAYLAEKEE